jgi:hypothetical protein
MALAPKMMKRGKLNIIPELIKDRSGVAALFKKSKAVRASDSGLPSSNHSDTKN